MKIYRTGKYLFLAVTIFLMAAALFSQHKETIMDIVFFGLGCITGGITIGMFKKHREVKRMRSY